MSDSAGPRGLALQATRRSLLGAINETRTRYRRRNRCGGSSSRIRSDELAIRIHARQIRVRIAALRRRKRGGGLLQGAPAVLHLRRAQEQKLQPGARGSAVV